MTSSGTEKGWGKMKTRRWIILPLLTAAVFMAFGIRGLIEYRKAEAGIARNESLRKAIAEVDRIEDPRAALEAYRGIVPSLPEVRLRILQKQWLVALDILRQIRLAKYNRVLEDDVPALYAGLTDRLHAMKELCGTVLTDDTPLRNEVAWRVYNLEGAARLLEAFTVLETEGNWKKVASMLAASISAFKSAVEAVDAAEVSNLEKDMPRWNLELLHEDIYVKKFTMVRPDSERLDLRDNLEAVIPEKGGYAPGEPLEKRIRK